MSKHGNLSDWQDGMMFSANEKRRGFASNFVNQARGLERGSVRILWVGFLTLMSILFARLFYLQFFESGQHNLLAASNHLERIRQYAERGIIYDRTGTALVSNIKREDGTYTREYALGEAGGHVLGYIAPVIEKELGCAEGVCNEPGMIVGRAGVEKMLDAELRGRDGGRLVELDARGQEVRELGLNVPEKGADVYLSIDGRLQKIMMEALAGRMGSAVAVDLQGKVLGLVSSPGYDSNLFTTQPDENKLSQMLSDNNQQYFLDRAISGVYPPGSVFKLVTSYAGLEDGAIDKDTLIEDTGEIRIDQYRYGNWYFDQYGKTEGQINVVRALARSNDVFYYKVGEMIGIEALDKYAHDFGYGDKTGIELPGEKMGLVPDKLWKERATGEKWFLGNTYHMSIGQGDLQVTPVQVARMTVAAVSGRLCKFSLLKDSKVICNDLGLKTDNIATVREGMKEVCQTGGTAFPFFDFQPWVLCKTGTAQHAGQKTESDKPHAWITVAYPGENPELVLTVMLDSAGEGSYEAGPVAKRILEQWRDLKK